MVEDRNRPNEELMDELAAYRTRVEELESLLAQVSRQSSREYVEPAVRRFARETETLAEVARIINSSLDIDEVYERFAREVRKVISFERISITEIDRTTATYRLLYVSGKEVGDRLPGAVVPLRGSFTERVARSGASLLLLMSEGDSAEGRMPSLRHGLEVGFLSFIAVPMITKGEVVGILHLRSSKEKAFTERDRRLAESVGAEIASAFANARLYEQLRVQAEELRRSNAELEQFAYVASHDLQEPLRMVSSYVQLLSHRYKDRLDSDADEFISFAVDGAHRMQLLIEALLTYSRVGTRELHPEKTNLNVVFDQAAANLSMAVESSGGVVTKDALPTLTADSQQMLRLLQNLLSNALKFRGDEPPRVHVASRREGNDWLFSVSDNGIGIPPEHRQRVFLVFQRLHGRGQYEGTGIGLAMCKRIVERHHGRIWIGGESGNGSVFHFTLPISPQEGEIR